MRWLWILCVLMACRTQPTTATPESDGGGLNFDRRCAEDCADDGAVFDRVEYSVAITGEDSWVCICRKGEEELRLW